MSSLEGKVALVTGSGRGLGRAYALRLAAAGADVVISDMNLASAREYDEELTAATVMDEVRALGRRSIGIEADLAVRVQVASALGRIMAEFGRVDILVNNAGGGLTPPGNPTEEEIHRHVMAINLDTTVNCCGAVTEPMKSQGCGKIVNISSYCGLSGRGGGVPYSIAKAGVAQYTRVLAWQLGPFGINVNCIAPAYILTSRKEAEGMGEGGLEQQVALRRLGTPEDCAKVVEFLCSDLSDYVTGQTISVCGGVVL